MGPRKEPAPWWRTKESADGGKKSGARLYDSPKIEAPEAGGKRMRNTAQMPPCVLPSLVHGCAERWFGGQE
jgi:hypothetical protein